MKKSNFIKYYRVFQNDTAVSEVSANNLKKPQVVCRKVGGPDLPIFSLPSDGTMFYGYLSKIKAMEMAKAGALNYINKIIRQVQQGIDLLTKYRFDHYEDLNATLLDANIRKLEQQMHIK